MKRRGSQPPRRQGTRRRTRPKGSKRSIFTFRYQKDTYGKVSKSPMNLWNGMGPGMAKHWWDYFGFLLLVFLLVVTGGTIANVYFSLADLHKLQFLQEDPHIFDAPWERHDDSVRENAPSPDAELSGAEEQASGSGRP